ncbi:MAG: ATP-binding protein [Chloroflexota bacterium]
MMKRPVVLFVFSLVGALAGAMLVLALGASPPPDDVPVIAGIMVGTGIVTIVPFYLLFQRRVAQFTSLLWVLMGNIVIIVLIMFFNVFISARLMFINDADLVLTTALLVFAGMTALGFGFLITHTITERIHLLVMATRDIAQGHFGTRLAETGQDEIADLTQAINTMAGSLEQMDATRKAVEQKRRDLIVWVSHDLRTPLTSMQVMIEALVDGVANKPEVQQRYYAQTLEEIDNLNGLIDNLFELTQLDAGHINLNRKQASLRQLIDDVLESMRARAIQKNITFRSQIDPAVDPITIDPEKIQRVLANLIDNAISYMPDEGTISVRAVAKGDNVVVSVHNTGTFIPPEYLPRLFERFYRVEGARTHEPNTGQRKTGLGLSIAQGFVEAHGGQMDVRSSERKGTVFRVVLPRNGRRVRA